MYTDSHIHRHIQTHMHGYAYNTQTVAYIDTHKHTDADIENAITMNSSPSLRM